MLLKYFVSYSMKNIKGFIGYKITPKGEVWSFRWPNKPRKLRPMKMGKGQYLAYGLLINNTTTKRIAAHRLVAQNYVPGYFEGAVVNHIDGDKYNNHYTNLEWVTQKENVHHYFKKY